MTESRTRSKAKKRSRRKAAKPPAELRIGETVVPPGETMRLELPVARLPTGNWLALPVVAVHGAKPGPSLWLDGAIHGDELNGMEIIHRVLERLDPKKLAGRVLAVPIVNVFGFIQQTRYLPDRRDLNRHFPGSKRGSLASRLARLFMEEIVAQCAYGIDLHTGSFHRTNLPQIRADLKDPETRRIAEAFGAPMMYRAKSVGGSLRAAASRRGASVLTYEAGEPLRFDEQGIDVGVAGVLRVLAALGMRKLQKGERRKPRSPYEAGSTRWLRATRSGVVHLAVRLGQKIAKGDVIANISDPAGEYSVNIRSKIEGLVIGYTNNPLIHLGDALVHIAKPKTT